MKQFLVLLIAILLNGCVANQGGLADMDTGLEETVSLANLGAAPELTNEVWLNVEEPLRLADLRGRVVLLDMWTFG
jgi:hypothetical protein